MKYQDYIHHITHRSPNRTSYEPLTRFYKNSKGIDTAIVLQRVYWEYVDWLEARGDIVFEEWVIHCELNPIKEEDLALSETLMYWLWRDECNRFRDGLPTHSPCPPMGYEGWADQYHKHKAGVASITHMLKQKRYEKPVPISVILGSVKELPVKKINGLPVD